MRVNDTLANTTRAAHDVGLAAWLGGAMFGKLAHNLSLVKIASHTERGSVSNAAWNGYNPVNALGLGTAAIGWAAARVTEANNGNLTGRERGLSTAKDGLMAASLLTGVLSGIQGARLGRQAPDGAVPVETGTKPASETPPKAAGIQRTLGALGNLNIASGVALVAVNAILAQTSHSRPAPRRAARMTAGTTRSVRSGSPRASPPPRPSPTSSAAGSLSLLTERNHVMANNKPSKGVSLAKGPVLVVGLALLIYGVLALIFGGHGFEMDPSRHRDRQEVPRPRGQRLDEPAVHRRRRAARLRSPIHWGAKSLSLIVGLVLGAASVIALVDGDDVFGIFAANGLTKLVWGIAAAVLLVLALLPRVGGNKPDDDDQDRSNRRVQRETRTVEREPRYERDTTRNTSRSRNRAGSVSADTTRRGGDAALALQPTKPRSRAPCSRATVNHQRSTDERTK